MMNGEMRLKCFFVCLFYLDIPFDPVFLILVLFASSQPWLFTLDLASMVYVKFTAELSRQMFKYDPVTAFKHENNTPDSRSA